MTFSGLAKTSVLLTLATFFTPEHPTSYATSISGLPYIGFNQDEIDLQNQDARSGLHSIFAGGDFHYGLPFKLYQRIEQRQGLTDDRKWQTFGAIPSPPFRTGPGKNVALGESLFPSNGDDFVNGNCFSCHAGVVAGKVYSGVGNAHIDTVSFKEFSNRLSSRSGTLFGRIGLLFLLNRNERQILKSYENYLETILLPAVDAQARGENHGPFVIWRMIARMIDPARGLDIYRPSQRSPWEYLLERQLPPVDPNPWWHFKYKKRAFWTQDVSQNSYATFALNLMDPHSSNTRTFPWRMERMRKQLAYVEQVPTPEFPNRALIDRSLASEGMELFHGRQLLATGNTLPCASCHGHYDSDGELTEFPEHRPIDWRVIGTDPAYASILHNEFKALYERFQQSPFAPDGEDTIQYPEVVGYTPPPLKGIWASAPYFHNGSVPTVYHVLKSSERPAYWLKSIDPDAYDFVRLGLTYRSISGEEYDHLKSRALRTGDRLSDQALYMRRVYSTIEFGRTNLGHTFGDQMNDRERTAVLEFLKLL